MVNSPNPKIIFYAIQIAKQGKRVIFGKQSFPRSRKGFIFPQIGRKEPFSLLYFFSFFFTSSFFSVLASLIFNFFSLSIQSIEPIQGCRIVIEIFFLPFSI